MKYTLLFIMMCINTIIQAQNLLPIIKLTGNFGYDYQEGTVSIIYPDGSSEDHTFFGLRNDNNWILDAGQADVFRLRNRIATELWNDFATKPYYINEESKALSGNHVDEYFDLPVIQDYYLFINILGAIK